MDIMLDENRNGPDLNSEFFNSKYEKLDLREQRLEISRKYLGIDDQTDHSHTPTFNSDEVIQNVESKMELPHADFRYIHGSIKPDETAKFWGFSLDPKIAELTITLNRLGLYTASACEGHPDRGSGYPEISFWNEDFYKVLSYLKEWNSPAKKQVMVRSIETTADDVKGQMFKIFFKGGMLEESQEISNKFLEFLLSQAK